MKITSEDTEKFERVKSALMPLALIADAYEASQLDEHRPEWTIPELGFDPRELVLVEGRGGATLLTLQHALDARAILREIS